MHNLDFLIPIVLFGSIAAILFKIYDDRHRERMMIIEKGLVSEDVKHLYANKFTWRVNPLSSLKWGMLIAFVGAGILLGSMLSASLPWMNHESLMFGFVFLFGGIGLILFYAMAAKKMPPAEL
jgi:hypothetical protein